MTTILDDAVVGGILLTSVLYAVYSLGPRTLRQRLLTFGASVLPGGLGRRVRIAAEVKSGGACGGCDSCGSNSAAKTDKLGVKSGEVRIPVSQIGKR